MQARPWQYGLVGALLLLCLVLAYKVGTRGSGDTTPVVTTTPVATAPVTGQPASGTPGASGIGQGTAPPPGGAGVSSGTAGGGTVPAAPPAPAAPVPQAFGSPTKVPHNQNL